MPTELKWDKCKEQFCRQVDAALNVVVQEILSDIRDELSEPYPPASLPGEPPHMRSGTLRDSWHTTEADQGEASIYSTDPVALYAEYGTETEAPRPIIQPVEEKWRDKFKKRLETLLGM